MVFAWGWGGLMSSKMYTDRPRSYRALLIKIRNADYILEEWEILECFGQESDVIRFKFSYESIVLAIV
jgi:hypothetical protein